MSFCHLHTHSCFSFLDALPTPEELAVHAAGLGLSSLALTDHNNVSGAVRFYKACLGAGIKPIQGAEVTLQGGYHLTLLAQGPRGYSNLCRILTDAYLGGHTTDPKRPQARFESLLAYNGGLFCLSGCRKGEIPRLLLRRCYKEAKMAAERYLMIFGPDRFFLEIQNHSLPFTRRLNHLLVQLGEHLGIPLVATHNVHYLLPEDYWVRDAFVCVRTLTRLEETHPERPFNGREWMLSPIDMEHRFRNYPLAIENTLRIAEQCQPALNLHASLLPRFPDLGPDESAFSVLARLVFKGAQKRYTPDLSSPVKARLRHELEIIHQLGYSDYFLIVWDVAEHARREGIRFAGRGSAADSAIAYCLGLTEVDSIRRGLLFERFLSRERAQKPDIDIDFDARYRDDVTKYIYEKYGTDRVATVCTFNTYHARSAVRDLGKAMGFPAEEIDRLAKVLPGFFHAGSLEEALEVSPALRECGLPLEQFRLLFRLCKKVAGRPRFIGTHLGGVVISGPPLNQVTPLQTAAKGIAIVQFDKDDIEELGLVKLDLLCLRMLSAVEDSLQTLEDQGNPLDYSRIPLDDPATYELLRSGETVGVFQLESPAQRALQARLGASEFEDVVASVALIRPGPIEGNMVEPFIARRKVKPPLNTSIRPWSRSWKKRSVSYSTRSR